jgi:hypothetical protein
MDYQFANYQGVINSVIDSQAALAEYLAGSPQFGDMVVMKTILQFNSPLTENNINVVLKTRDDFSALKPTMRGVYETHLVSNLADTTHPWVRWVDISDFVVLNEERRKEVLNVVLQNRLERLKEHAKAHFV